MAIFARVLTLIREVRAPRISVPCRGVIVMVGKSDQLKLPPTLPVVGTPWLPKAEPPEMPAEVFMLVLMLETVTN